MAWLTPNRSRRAPAVALVLWAGALASALSACEALPPPDPTEPSKQEDLEAKKAFYEENAQAYYDGRQYIQSVQQWRMVLSLEPERQKAKWGLAKSLQMVGTPETLRESITIFREIIDLDWSHPTLGDRRHEVMKDFADSYASLADFYDQDIGLLEKRLEAPDADSTMLRQQLATQTSTRNDLLSKAIPLYEGALARSPNNPYAIGGLAKANLMVGNDAKGIEYARRYIAISQHSQSGYQQELDAVTKERGQASEDVKKLLSDRIRGAQNKELKIHLLLATVLVRNHDYPGAIAEYDRVLALDPATPAAYLERGQAYAMNRDYRHAIGDIEQYLRITDPVKHRQQRLAAGDLLQKYRALEFGAPIPAPVPSPGAQPAPPPPPAPIPVRR